MAATEVTRPDTRDSAMVCLEQEERELLTDGAGPVGEGRGEGYRLPTF